MKPTTIRVKRKDVAKRQSERLASTVKLEEYRRSIREVRKPLFATSFYQRIGVQL
jgi:hypothetical protein